MSDHHALIHWQRSGSDFRKLQYSREHTWRFDGGIVVAASASPSVVPAPWSNPAGIDPEEAFVAAVASCHMLSWLPFAARGGFVVDTYRDEAVGRMSRNSRGGWWVSAVTLHPAITYAGGAPSPEQEAHWHHLAHEQCFIANSIRTEVTVEPAPRELSPPGETAAR